jgi:hypothetical protein
MPACELTFLQAPSERERLTRAGPPRPSRFESIFTQVRPRQSLPVLVLKQRVYTVLFKPFAQAPALQECLVSRGRCVHVNPLFLALPKLISLFDPLPKQPPSVHLSPHPPLLPVPDRDRPEEPSDWVTFPKTMSPLRAAT